MNTHSTNKTAIFPTPRMRIIMSETRILNDFAFEPRWDEADRILKMRTGTVLSETAHNLMNQTRGRMHEIVQPAAVYGFFLPDSIETDVFATPDWIGLCVVTMGHRVDQTIEQNNAAGQIAVATLVDAFGSAYVEGAANALNQTLVKEGEAMGLHAGPRKSPGFGRWPLACQRTILTRLNADRLLIRITESDLLIPQKTISFGVPFRKTQ